MKRLKDIARYLIGLTRNILKRNLLIQKGIQIKTSKETIDYILKHRCSVSRYGDGEINMIKGFSGAQFQNYNSKLGARLLEVLNSNIENHIVCLPQCLISTKNYNRNAKLFWINFRIKTQNFICEIIDLKKVYYDTQITRFYYPYKQKNGCLEHVLLLTKIWENRDVVLIEGEKTRSGVGNDLFKSAKTIKRIIAPSENAFDKYNDIIYATKQVVNQGNLVLISLGMTATVLAYDLSLLGFQAIDLGHLDIEYEWYKMKANGKVAVKGKYVNEVLGGCMVQDCIDTKYKEQILIKIK